MPLRVHDAAAYSSLVGCVAPVPVAGSPPARRAVPAVALTAPPFVSRRRSFGSVSGPFSAHSATAGEAATAGDVPQDEPPAAAEAGRGSRAGQRAALAAAQRRDRELAAFVRSLKDDRERGWLKELTAVVEAEETKQERKKRLLHARWLDRVYNPTQSRVKAAVAAGQTTADPPQDQRPPPAEAGSSALRQRRRLRNPCHAPAEPAWPTLLPDHRLHGPEAPLVRVEDWPALGLRLTQEQRRAQSSPASRQLLSHVPLDHYAPPPPEEQRRATDAELGPRARTRADPPACRSPRRSRKRLLGRVEGPTLDGLLFPYAAPDPGGTAGA
eukprot:EG_transcript_16502